MEAKKVLFITQEITPYVPESEMSKLGRQLPQAIQEASYVLSKKYGFNTANLGLRNTSSISRKKD